MVTTEQEAKDNRRQELTNREIRGVTGKVLIWFFGGTISIMITVVLTYANIMYQLKDNQRDKQEAQIKMGLFEAGLKDLQQKQQTNDIRISRIEENIKDKVFLKDAPGSR